MAALKIAGRQPPGPAGRLGQPTAGNASSSSGSNSQVCAVVQSTGAAASATRSGQPSASAIGSRMSGGLHWAIVEPSRNSTIEWMTDCGCTMTSMSSYGDAEQLVRLDHLERPC